MRARTALAASLVLALAGCLATPAKDLGPGATAPADPGAVKAAAMDAVKALMQGVPCDAPSVTAATSANLKDLASVHFDHGGTQSLDTHGDLMIAANGPTMATIDLTDPLHPKTLGNYTASKGIGDLKISPDNATAVVGALDHIDLVDIRNPREPAKVGSWDLASVGHVPTDLNAHMIYTAQIGGRPWVFLAPNNDDGIWILRLVGPPERRSLEYVTSTLPLEGGPIGPHDLWVHRDEDAKSWLLYSADGFEGWAVFNVDDPATPTLVGGLVRPETGYVHTIQAAKVNGKRIVATIAEVGFNLLQVYDATDLMAPTLIATWHVSEESALPQPAAPQHEFNIVAGRLYLGHYANGFYVFDLTKVPDTPLLGTPALRPVAHYAVGDPPAVSLFSDVWSVDVIDGILYASSMKDGVHGVGYGCNTPGDPLLRSTG